MPKIAEKQILRSAQDDNFGQDDSFGRDDYFVGMIILSGCQFFQDGNSFGMPILSG